MRMRTKKANRRCVNKQVTLCLHSEWDPWETVLNVSEDLGP